MECGEAADGIAYEDERTVVELFQDLWEQISETTGARIGDNATVSVTRPVDGMNGRIAAEFGGDRIEVVVISAVGMEQHHRRAGAEGVDRHAVDVAGRHRHGY